MKVVVHKNWQQPWHLITLSTVNLFIYNLHHLYLVIFSFIRCNYQVSQKQTFWFKSIFYWNLMLIGVFSLNWFGDCHGIWRYLTRCNGRRLASNQPSTYPIGCIFISMIIINMTWQSRHDYVADAWQLPWLQDNLLYFISRKKLVKKNTVKFFCPRQRSLWE